MILFSTQAMDGTVVSTFGKETPERLSWELANKANYLSGLSKSTGIMNCADVSKILLSYWCRQKLHWIRKVMLIYGVLICSLQCPSWLKYEYWKWSCQLCDLPKLYMYLWFDLNAFITFMIAYKMAMISMYSWFKKFDDSSVSHPYIYIYKSS